MHLHISDAEQTGEVSDFIYLWGIFREEEMYYVLMDIMRSPEIIKQITGSSLKKKID